jgi:hypothetical protein
LIIAFELMGNIIKSGKVLSSYSTPLEFVLCQIMEPIIHTINLKSNFSHTYLTLDSLGQGLSTISSPRDNFSLASRLSNRKVLNEDNLLKLHGNLLKFY